jgi:hypothetical protein
MKGGCRLSSLYRRSRGSGGGARLASVGGAPEPSTSLERRTHDEIPIPFRGRVDGHRRAHSPCRIIQSGSSRSIGAIRAERSRHARRAHRASARHQRSRASGGVFHDQHQSRAGVPLAGRAHDQPRLAQWERQFRRRRERGRPDGRLRVDQPIARAGRVVEQQQHHRSRAGKSRLQHRERHQRCGSDHRHPQLLAGIHLAQRCDDRPAASRRWRRNWQRHQ